MNRMDDKTWQRMRRDRERRLRLLENGTPSKYSLRSLMPYIVGFLISVPAVAFGYYAFQNYAAESAIEMSGSVINVRAGGDLQRALAGAKPGDTILLEAGATFKGNFDLPMKPGADFITIRAAVDDSHLPGPNARLDPKRFQSVLPKLASPNNDPVITAVNGAHHYRFIAVEFEGTRDGAGNIIKLGTTEEKRAEDLPHHIEFDHVYIHGVSHDGQRRGIAANARFVKITNSYFSDLKRKGDESQAVAVWATDGPVEITNNYLEGATQSVLFGGAGSNLKLVPTDCIVRDNWMNKPVDWRNEGWDVKNLFEIKNGRRIKVENNLMTGNWGSAQDGTAVLFSTRADNGRETIIEDIEFTNNIVRGSGNGISVYGAEGSGGHRLTIRNNIFDDINGERWNGAGRFMKSTAWDGLRIENNTIINSGSIASIDGDPVRGFVFRNNIVFENEFGFKGDSTASGNATLDRFYPGADVTYNAIIGGDASRYRGKNLFPSSVRQIGFINFEGNDLRLGPDSSLRARGFQGRLIGADLDAKTVGGTF
jgi:hypothetical protein